MFAALYESGAIKHLHLHKYEINGMSGFSLLKSSVDANDLFMS